MPDTRIDDYIAASAPFARPLLGELRSRLHRACPEVEETIKWGMPAFTYRGRLLAVMGAFKAHATFGFWQREAVGSTGREGEAMGQYGKLVSLGDLPGRAEFTRAVKAAMKLIETPAPPRPASRRVARPAPAVPDDLAAALGKNARAREAFESFSPSHRREYIEWIESARRADTRARRLARTLDWLTEGKSRNWKYEKC